MRVITNCATIELFVNGISAGIRTEGWLRTWQAPFRLGENHLHAVGRTDDGSTVADRLTQTLVEPAGPPAQWLLQGEATRWRDRPVTRLTVQLADVAGTPCVDREESVTFQLLGGRGRLLTDLGTPDGSGTYTPPTVVHPFCSTDLLRSMRSCGSRAEGSLRPIGA